MSARNLISENPFRVLGVYADSSAKDRAANASKLKAFLRVGKSVAFPSDFAAIMPAPKRTPESVAAAENALALPAERLRHAQFWFANAKPADAIAFNRLGNGDIAGATEIWAKIGQTSAVQNRLVCALIQGNLRRALADAELIYGNDVRLRQFAEIIVPEAAAGTDLEKLRNDFYETLCDAAGAESVLAAMPNSALRGRIRGRAAKPILDEIYALVAATKNERNRGPASALAAGTRLMNSARPLLQKLRNTAEESSSDFRLTADKVGLEVLQCAIDFYNKSDDEEAARRAMPLIKFAQSTVAGTLARERCDENARVMQKNLDALPPPGVAAERRAIDAELEKYNNAEHSERLLMARGLLERTKPHLQAMRAKLGASNPFYLHLSTEVVMAAAYPAYLIIKVMAETGKRPPEKAVYILLYVWGYVDLMDSFDLEDDFKDDYRMMRKFLERFHLAAKGISAGNSRQKQQEAQNKVTCVVLAIVAVVVVIFIAASRAVPAKIFFEMKNLMKTRILIAIAGVAAAFCGNAFAAVPAPGSAEAKEMLVWWEQNVRYKELNEKLDRTLQALEAERARIADAQSAAEKRQKKSLRANEAKLRAGLAEFQSQLAALREQLAALQQNSDGNASLQDALAASDAKLQKAAAALQENFGNELGKLQEKQNADRAALAGRIAEARADGKGDLQKNSLLAVGVALILAAAGTLVAIFLSRKIGRSKTAVAETNKVLEDVRSAQSALAQAHEKLREESIALDGKLLEILEKQLAAANAVPAQNSAPAVLAPEPKPSAPDHSLALKVANEIARMDLNLSRMDSSVKGYKQLTAAVRRMKDSFRVSGYEIVDMLGKPYNEGMKVIADFTIDESLPLGAQIIRSIRKPCVTFNGKMIQAAEIMVAQNI